MPVYFVDGDLFSTDCSAIGHGVNLMGVMGAGIAAEFRKKYPEMYGEYKKLCTEFPRKVSPGDVFVWRDNESGKYIFNLFTQVKIGRNAKYEYIVNSLYRARELLEFLNLKSFALPYIGCGIGGLNKEVVSLIIEAVFGDWDGILYVYSGKAR